MKVVGLVGPIGAGKSTMRNLFIEDNASKGYPLRIAHIDLDVISKMLVENNAALKKELGTTFGPIMIDSDFERRKKYVIEQIMVNDVLYAKMNKIMEKYLYDWLCIEIVDIELAHYDLVLVEGVTIIYSEQLMSKLDLLLKIWAPDHICKSRADERCKYTERQLDILYNRSNPPLSLDGLVKVHDIPTHLGTSIEYEEINFVLGRLFSLSSTYSKISIDKGDNITINSPGEVNVTIDNFVSPGISVSAPIEEHYPIKRERVAIYAGSFAPFHYGHLAVVEDLLDIFDHVIVLQCINGGKDIDLSQYKIPEDKLPKDCTVIEWGDAFVDFLESDFVYKSDSDLFIARGIRNSVDLEYEMNYITHLKGQCLFRDIEHPPVIFIPCRDEYKHISSGSIHAIMPFDPDYAMSMIV